MPSDSTTTLTKSGYATRDAAPLQSKFGRKNPALLLSLGLVSLLSLTYSCGALAATAPPLGSASNFAIVSDTFTNSGNPTTINGSVCYTTPPPPPPPPPTRTLQNPRDTQIA